jgi:hypothetical protein
MLKMSVFAQNNAKLCKNWIITLVFDKNANFFAENWQKSLKIITSTPGHSAAEHLNQYSKRLGTNSGECLISERAISRSSPGMPDGLFSNQKAQFG